MGKEHRTSPRLKALLPIDYQMDEEHVFLFHLTDNISKAGTYIYSDELLPIGTKLDLVFSIFDLDPTTAADEIVLKGEVVKVHEKPDPETGRQAGMGVKFVDLTDETWAALEEAAKSVSEKNPMDLTVVTPEATQKVHKHIEMMRRHYTNLRKEAAARIKDYEG